MNSQKVTSSNIDSIWYSDENCVLEIIFLDGSVYHYYDVPSNEYDWIMSASSHGSYLHQNIKGQYRYEQV
jgi:hypothetical protein